MGHEYTHVLTKHIVNWSNVNETSAINEAISDIMGEMIEAWRYGECDWENCYRNLGTPADNKEEEGYHISSYGEYNSSMISHTAYLMWIGDESNNGIEAINNANLMSELWCRTILLLNSDASFADCRICFETVAEQMMNSGWLTEAQYNCILWTFDQAGIPTSDSMRFVGDQFEINVCDYAGNPMEEYVMTVSDYDGQMISTLYGEQEGSCVTLNLGAGIYRITVSSPDAAFHDVSSVETVAKKQDSYIDSNSTIDIYTTFGTSLQGQVTNEDGQPLEGVQVTIEPAPISLAAVEQLSEETGVAQEQLLALQQATTGDAIVGLSNILDKELERRKPIKRSHREVI